MKQSALAMALCLCAGGSFAQPAVTPADIVGSYFTAADGFETRIVHPKWKDDRLVVEDIRFRGHYPEIVGFPPPDATGAGIDHPANMLNGVLAYVAPTLFGGPQSQVVVFYRTEGPATGGIHATIIFDGPPEGGPGIFGATTRTATEWTTGLEDRLRSRPD